MISAQTSLLEKLNQLFNAEYNSLTRCIIEASPYVPDSMQKLWSVVQKIRTEEEQSAKQIAVIITKLEGVPDTESYNPDIGDINYLSLPALLPRLLAFKQDLANRYEEALEQCPNSQSEICSLLSSLALRTQNHINLLQTALKQ
ncbi:MAG: hypothetical protein N2246_04180 [Candidatus Sumerlaeia bacterium]|nr:hypothetical protein [Candidatus Sumerlaeia bacterium]